MTLRRLVPGGEDIDPDDRAALLDLYRPPREDWFRLNFVATLDGNAAGVDGTSESLTSRPDRRILGVIRELSDVVLIGAGSVRAEGFQVPKRAHLAIVTRSGDLGGHLLDDVSRVTVLGPASARDGVAATLGAEFVELEGDAIVTVLRAHGWRSIVCEGGPTLAAALLAAGAVDECCLTTRPRLGGASLPWLADGVAPTELSLQVLLADEDGTLFARWLVQR